MFAFVLTPFLLQPLIQVATTHFAYSGIIR